MSKAGIDFVNKWVEHHIVSSPVPRASEERIEYDVAACVAEAARKGITREEIEEDIGDIGEYIRDAMGQAATDELHSNAARDE